MAKADARDAGKPETAPQLLAAMQRRYESDTGFRNQVKNAARIARKAANPSRAVEAIPRASAEVAANLPI